MADYKDIVGTAVRNNAGNLSSDQQDQIFYDSTNVDFKYQFEATTDAWRTGGSLNSGRIEFPGAGTQTNAIVISGYTGPAPSFTTAVELYDGTSWTETADVSTARRGIGGLGIYTAALAVTGSTSTSATPVTASNEQWNGSSWTEVGDVNTARGHPGAGGTTTAGLIFGGDTPPKSTVTESLEWVCMDRSC